MRCVTISNSQRGVCRGVILREVSAVPRRQRPAANSQDLLTVAHDQSALNTGWHFHNTSTVLIPEYQVRQYGRHSQLRRNTIKTDPQTIAAGQSIAGTDQWLYLTCQEIRWKQKKTNKPATTKSVQRGAGAENDTTTSCSGQRQTDRPVHSAPVPRRRHRRPLAVSMADAQRHAAIFELPKTPSLNHHGQWPLAETLHSR